LHLDMAIVTFKALNGLTPKYISDTISLVSNHHHYNTRQTSSKNIYQKHVPSNKLFSQSLKVIVLTSLEPTICLSQGKSILKFKSDCKKHFLN